MERTPNKEQRAVIENVTDNLLLYASAGTGKTFTVAQRVKKILKDRLARPEEILCLTFTIKACDEMREDILSGDMGAKNVSVKTIHGFCYDLIKAEAKRTLNGYVEPLVCDEVDQEEILKKLIPESFAAWEMEDFLKRNGIAETLDALSLMDVFFLARDVSRPDSPAERRTKEAGIFRKTEKGGKTVYFNAAGFVNEIEAAERMSRVHPSDVVCPECRKKQSTLGNFCTECGNDFRPHTQKLNFVLENHGGYRNLVSLLKHERVTHGFVTEDETKDFYDTYAAIKDSRALTAALTCKKGRYGEFDARLAHYMEKYAGALMHAYNAALKASNRLDFDDLILGARALLTDGEVLSRLRGRYKYIIIDEMQDTSMLEYDVLRRLFADSRVMMCGDYFQTIYEWRGSDPVAVLDDFRTNFHAVEYLLSENYRSTERLTRASFGFLKSTFPTLLGKFCPAEIAVNNSSKGDPIRHISLPSPKQEAWFVHRYLRQHPTSDPTKICVMSRSNGYIAKFSKLLNEINAELPAKERLRFFTVDGDFRFYKQPIVKDLLAFYTLLLSPTDTLAFERIAERYIRGVGRGILSALQRETSGLSLSSFLEDDTYSGGDPYRTLIDAVNWGNIVVYDIETTGLDTARDEIIQIAAMKIDRDGNEVASFNRMVVPTVEISQGALQTHGFSLEYIKEHGGTSACSALEAFSDFARGAVLVGHNSTKFDRAVVDRQLRECGLPPLEIKGEYDTLVLAKRLYPELPDHKLETLCKTFRIVNERAHDAFFDVAATAKIVAYFAGGTLSATAERREQTARKYRKRFEGFYGQYRTMREYFARGDLKGLNAYLGRVFSLFEGNQSDRETLSDLFLLLEQRQAECGSAALAVETLLTDAALSGSQMDVLIKKLNKIPIITVHQSKGCEFDTVLLVGVDNGNFPSFPSVQSGHEEEEARVFYVAISRAKKTLVTTCVEAGSKAPSPYLERIPKDCIERFRFENGKIVQAE